MSVAGFDFGTTNSLVSIIVGNGAINFLDNQGLPIPSIVCYEGTKKIVGTEAKRRLSDAGLGIKGNVVRSPKMYLDKESIFVEGVERSPVDIVADVVSFVLQTAQSGGQKKELTKAIDRAVVTIPVDMEGYRRAALRDAFRIAGVSIVQFVHEPLAALYGFFRSLNDLATMLRKYDRKLILVFDWGGGTLDLTLCRLVEGMLVQLRNDGTDEVGGDHFDEIMRNEIIRKFLKMHELDETVETQPDAKTRLLHECEMAKIRLSTRDQINIYVPNFFRDLADNADDLDYSLSRLEFEDFVAPLLDKGLGRISKLLESADIAPSQISLCLATGGMANMPAIKARLHEWFGPERVYVSDRSGTLIAEGAAWIAHDKAQLHLAKKVELLLARNSFLPIIDAGTSMPSEGEVKRDQFHLYCADPRDGHAKFQLCAPIRPGKMTMPNDKREPLANLTVSVDHKARPFQERLELDVAIDDNLILRAHARSLNKKSLDKAEIHNLEFGLSFPGIKFSGKKIDSLSEGIGQKQNHEPGSLAIRSNITNSRDNSLVPGELLHTYNPYYFDTRSNPPKIQDDERLYYQPCAICKRASNDPLCQCSSYL